MHSAGNQVSGGQVSDSQVSGNRIANLSPARRALLLGSVVLIFLLMLLAVAELGVRARMYVKYGTFWGFEIKAYDTETGLRTPKPNYRSGPVQINSLGFRSPELFTPKPEGLVRLAFLGGSTTFCQEVSNNDTVWPAVLTDALQEQYPQQQFDHINASVTAFDTHDSLINLEKRVAPHDPDVVFIYHAVNDLAVNGQRLAVQQGLSLSSQPTSPWFQKIIDTSLLAELIYKNLLILSKNKQAGDSTQKVTFDREFMVNEFRKDLGALVDSALMIAPVVVIPTFANHLRRDQSSEQQLLAANTHLFHIPYFTISDMLDAFESYNEVIREFSNNERVVVIETEQVIEGNSEFFVDSVHFTDKGSISLGQHLATELIKSGRFSK